MADYSDAADAALEAIAANSGLVEEYQYRNVRVRRGPLKDQIAAAAMAEGLAARRSAGLFRLAKFQGPNQ